MKHNDNILACILTTLIHRNLYIKLNLSVYVDTCLFGWGNYIYSGFICGFWFSPKSTFFLVIPPLPLFFPSLSVSISLPPEFPASAGCHAD